MNIKENLLNSYEELTFIDGFDDCIEGVCLRFGQEPIVCYDYNKIINKMITDEMTHDEAIEYFDFNIIGAYVGKTTPAFIEKMA